MMLERGMVEWNVSDRMGLFIALGIVEQTCIFSSRLFTCIIIANEFTNIETLLISMLTYHFLLII